MLSFKDFKKSYNGHEIINIPQLELSEGLYHLKGQNGSGKTTLIKCIAGLTPFQGEMELFTVPNTLKYQQAYRRLVSFAPSEPMYPGFMKGSDLIHLHENLRGKTDHDQKIMITLGVNKFQDQKISTYSSGMTKKLALALAFLGAPKLIILDEPMNALDAEAANALPAFIQAYLEQGSSFIITSHQDFAWSQIRSKKLSIQESKLSIA